MKHLVIICLAIASGVANAQWDTNTITWSGPTACTTGEPISACAVTGYRVERSNSPTGSYAAVGTSQTTSFTHTSAVAGVNCYRVIVMSNQGESVSSQVTTQSCKTNSRPVGPPNPATDLRVSATTAYLIKPNFQKLVFERGAAVGKAKLGASCDPTRGIGGGYFVIDRPSNVIPKPLPGIVLVAKCA